MLLWPFCTINQQIKKTLTKIMMAWLRLDNWLFAVWDTFRRVNATSQSFDASANSRGFILQKKFSGFLFSTNKSKNLFWSNSKNVTLLNIIWCNHFYAFNFYFQHFYDLQWMHTQFLVYYMQSLDTLYVDNVIFFVFILTRH